MPKKRPYYVVYEGQVVGSANQTGKKTYKYAVVLEYVDPTKSSAAMRIGRQVGERYILSTHTRLDLAQKRFDKEYKYYTGPNWWGVWKPIGIGEVIQGVPPAGGVMPNPGMQSRRLFLWEEDELWKIKKATLASILHGVFGQGTPKYNMMYPKEELVMEILIQQKLNLDRNLFYKGMLFDREELGAMRRQYLEHIAATYWGLGTYKRVGQWSKARLINRIMKAQKDIEWGP